MAYERSEDLVYIRGQIRGSAGARPDQSRCFFRLPGIEFFLVEKPAYSYHEFTFSQSGGGRLSGKAI